MITVQKQVNYYSRIVDNVVVFVLDYNIVLTSTGITKDTITKLITNRRNSSMFTLEQFQEIRILGVGSYGTVSLVRDKYTGMTYALKQMLKSIIVSNNHQKFIHNECSILKSIQHPFIVNLISTFADEKSVYILMEVCLGGEMYSLMRETVERLYAAGETDYKCFDISWIKVRIQK